MGRRWGRICILLTRQQCVQCTHKNKMHLHQTQVSPSHATNILCNGHGTAHCCTAHPTPLLPALHHAFKEEYTLCTTHCTSQPRDTRAYCEWCTTHCSTRCTVTKYYCYTPPASPFFLHLRKGLRSSKSETVTLNCRAMDWRRRGEGRKQEGE